MKQLLSSLLLIISGISYQVQAQTVKIVNSQSSVNQLVSRAGGPPAAVYAVKVVLACLGVTPANDVTINFSIQHVSDVAQTPQLLTASIVVPKEKFTTSGQNDTTLIYFSLPSTPPITHDAYFDLMITGATGPADALHRVVISNGPAHTSIIHNVDTTALSPLISDKPSSVRRSYLLHYEVYGKLAKDTTINLTLTNNSGNSITPTLLTTQFTIPASACVNGYYAGTVSVSLTINAQKEFDDDETMYIQFANDAPSDVLIFSRRELVKPNKPFWIEVGSNFDFADGLQPNNFFSGVFLHRRDLLPVHLFNNKERGARINNSSWRNLGIFAGVYESKSISTISELEGYTREHYDPTIALADTSGNIGVFRDTGYVKKIQVVRNISLFWSPQLRLTSKSANTDGLHIFTSLWFEMQWQKVSVENDFSRLVRKDTFFVAAAQRDFYVSEKQKASLDIKTHYAGIGLPIYFRENDVTLFVNTVLGWSTQPRAEELQPYFDGIKQGLPDRIWRPFYLWQFRLSEERYGFAFTGEIRGLVMRNAPPIISLCLSKKFDLTKFLEFK